MKAIIKTKFLLCLALVPCGLFCLTGKAQSTNDVKIMMDIPSFGWNGQVSRPAELQNRYPASDHFYVVIENISDKTIFLTEGNGEISGLSFEIVAADHKTVMVHRLQQQFQKHVVGEFAVPPGQAKVEEIYYNLDWGTFPFPQNTNITDNKTLVSLRAVLEVKPSTNAEQRYLKGCWTGKAVSVPFEVTLLNDAIEN